MKDFYPQYTDFTRANYMSLLKLAKKNYVSMRYHENFRSAENFILWRHDVDYSPHAALALAKMEQQEGIIGTYFLLPGCSFYNLLEPAIRDIIKQILSLGHDIGLHFDFSAYAIINQQDLEKYLTVEKQILESIFAVPVRAFSFHNPNPQSLAYDAFEYAGMVNCYAQIFRQQIDYSSDSNGVWRFRRMHDVLLKAERSQLQILTHPGWWLSVPMQPRSRIARAVVNRAINVFYDYNQALHVDQRPNPFELHEVFAQLQPLPKAAWTLLQLVYVQDSAAAFLMLQRYAYRKIHQACTIILARNLRWVEARQLAFELRAESLYAWLLPTRQAEINDQDTIGQELKEGRTVSAEKINAAFLVLADMLAGLWKIAADTQPQLLQDVFNNAKRSGAITDRHRQAIDKLQQEYGVAV